MWVLWIDGRGMMMETACGQTNEARPHPVSGNGVYRMGDAQGSRGAWIDGRQRDREMAVSSSERVRGGNRVGRGGTLAALARRALSVRCVACTTFMVWFVAMFVWG